MALSYFFRRLATKELFRINEEFHTEYNKTKNMLISNNHCGVLITTEKVDALREQIRTLDRLAFSMKNTLQEMENAENSSVVVEDVDIF
jgi:hypothetical protein